MPKLEKLSTWEAEHLRSAGTRSPDLSEYVSYLRGLKSGDWGRASLESGDRESAVKRRLTIAGKLEGMQIKFRYGKAEQGQIIFEVM